MKVAYCTGFWCTNIGNGFFSMGVEFVLKKIMGEQNVTVVSDFQTYTTSYGKRLYPDRNQLEYLSEMDVDYLVLAGPVISRYFLLLWKQILLKLQKRGIGYMILSAGTMKLNNKEKEEIQSFFTECPPFAFSSREESSYEEFGHYAIHAYNGICFSFFAPDFYTPSQMKKISPYVIFNFDKISEPVIELMDQTDREEVDQFVFEGKTYRIAYPGWLNKLTATTDRYTDALAYVLSVLPAKSHADNMGEYKIIRTDHRFHPHYRRKIFRQNNSFVADLPYGYLNLYANAELTLSDRVHACAVTLAFGHSAMMFAKTKRTGLLGRVGATEICDKPVKLDLKQLEEEKMQMVNWLNTVLKTNNGEESIT